MKKLILLLFVANFLAACNGVNVKITSVDVHIEGQNHITPGTTSLVSESDWEADGKLPVEVTP